MIWRPIRLALLAIFVLCTSASPAPHSAAAGADQRLGAAIDAYARPLIEAHHLSGQLLVARRGQILVEREFGFADWELRAPVTPDTRFNIASVTKPMTITLAIQLMAEHAFGLKDSIARWFPDFPKGNRITVEMLLQHSSGIPHELVPDSEATRPMTAAAMVEIAKHRQLDFEPGSKSSYSSGGFSVLTRILEIAGGKSYGELLEARIFGQLGMTSSSDHDSRVLLPGRARSVVPGPRGLENGPYQDFSGIIGAGSVWSTARDLHRFVQGLVTGKLGPGPQRSLAGDKVDFNGYTAGFRAYCDWDSVSGLEVIFVGNEHSGAPDLLRSAIPKLAAGEAVAAPVLPAMRPGAVAEAELRRSTGTFQLGNGTKLELTVHDGALWANDWVLLPMADGGFFSPRDYGKVHVVRAADGTIERLDWEQRGEVYPAPRVK